MQRSISSSIPLSHSRPTSSIPILWSPYIERLTPALATNPSLAAIQYTDNAAMNTVISASQNSNRFEIKQLQLKRLRIYTDKFLQAKHATKRDSGMWCQSSPSPAANTLNTRSTWGSSPSGRWRRPEPLTPGIRRLQVLVAAAPGDREAMPRSRAVAATISRF
jgi:hypothetical protein